jgi:hypothetical protein
MRFLTFSLRGYSRSSDLSRTGLVVPGTVWLPDTIQEKAPWNAPAVVMKA